MRWWIRRHGGRIGMALLLVSGLVVVALVLRARPSVGGFGPDHGRWVALATAQAATFTAQLGPRVVASPVATATRAPTPLAAVPAPPAAPPAVPIASGTPVQRQPTTPATPPAPVPTPSPKPVPTQPPAATPVPLATATATFRASHQLVATGPVNLRDAPGTAAAVVATVMPDTSLMATGEEGFVDGQVWRRFVLDNGLVGWILGAFAEPLGR